TAQAATKGFAAPAAGTVGTVDSSGSATLAQALVTAQADSTASDINLGNGLVTIDSVVSSATATSDGTSGQGKGSTTVNGMMVGGQPATVDQDGLHIGGTSQPI